MTAGMIGCSASGRRDWAVALASYAPAVVQRYDVAVIGAGGAGQLLLLALACADLDIRVAVVDPVTRTGHDRTWCWWGAGAGIAEAAVDSSWRHLRVAGGGSPEVVLDLDPLRYRLIRSPDLYRLVGERVAAARRLRVDRYEAAAADDVRGAGEEVAFTVAGEALSASWVFDSRPAPPVSGGRVHWRQQFLGWVLPAQAVPDVGEVPFLMDFRTRQPTAGLSFGYCLPMRDRTVLVEYTEFSPEIMTDAAATAALLDYLRLLGVAGDVRIDAVAPGAVTPGAVPSHVERGSIPMTDARFARRAGERVFRLGTAGGATRGSTGYTFAAMIRQAEAVAAALAVGRVPAPPPAYPSRHRWMDAVMLRALDDRLVDGPAFFRQLFRRQPIERVLRFLDGASTRGEDLAIMASAPLPAMTRAAVLTALPPWQSAARNARNAQAAPSSSRVSRRG